MYALINNTDSTVEIYTFNVNHDNTTHTKKALTQAEIDEINSLKAVVLSYNGTNFIDSATAEQKKDKNKSETKARYEFHKQNGWNEYQDFRAEIVEDIANNVITEPQAFVIESYLNDKFLLLCTTGDWKSAQYKLTQTTIAAEHSFVQPYYDSAVLTIANYITNNYN